MWDFSSRNTNAETFGASDCVTQTSTSLITYENDALMVVKRIDNQIKSAKKKLRKMKLDNDANASKIERNLVVLRIRKRQADLYVKRIRKLRETEALLKECKRNNIDPGLRIITGGGTLKTAANELENFRQEHVLFQEFDRDYDLN